MNTWSYFIAVCIVIICTSPLSLYADVPYIDLQLILSHVIAPPPGALDYAQDVAVKKVLQRLVRKPDGTFDALFATRLGFEVADPLVVQQATSSFPLALFEIGLRRLQQFNPAVDDPLKLIAADSNWLSPPSPLPVQLFPARYLFPISITIPSTAQNAVSSSVRVLTTWSPTNPTPTNLDFEIERFGSSTLIRLIDKWRRVPHTTGPIQLEYFLISVPALDRYYLGKVRGNEFKIKAITDDRQVTLKEGEEDAAKEVFRKLKAEALTIDADNPIGPPR